jgi:hypothetical protein
MPCNPAQAAEALYGLLPRAVSRDTLEEYGVEATAAQARQITRELLSVNLFWVESALKVSLAKKDAELVFEALRRRVTADWTSGFGLEGHDPQDYFREVGERRQAYDRIVQDGGEPIAVLMETVSLLEADGTFGAEVRPKILGLLVDLVPEEAIGDAVQEFA